MTAILTFLGGSAFRMIFGHITDWLNKRQEQAHELAVMELQGKLDAEAHTRNMESIRLQAELGIKTIEAQAVARSGELEMEGWSAAVAAQGKPTGIRWVDAWNGIIRPLCASIAIFLWVRAINAAGWHMTDWDQQLVGVILGFFFASRIMAGRDRRS